MVPPVAGPGSESKINGRQLFLLGGGFWSRDWFCSRLRELDKKQDEHDMTRRKAADRVALRRGNSS